MKQKKTKAKKINTQNIKAKKQFSNVPENWLYMNTEVVELSQIYEQIKEEKAWKAEFWKEAGVLECAFLEAGSLDMEEMDCDLEDEAGNAFLEKEQIHSLFAVTIRPEDYEQAKLLMKFMIEKVGGFFCGDTEEFLPRVN